MGLELPPRAEIGPADLLSDPGALAGRGFRTLCGAMVGAGLATSGLLQGLTRNPLADPGITGINAGAALGTLGLLFALPQAGGGPQLVAAAAGAGAAGAGLGTLAGVAGGGLRLRLPLAGLAIEALCLSLVSGLALSDATLQSRHLHWLAGALPMAPLHEGPALAAAPSLIALPRLELLSLGADRSASFGRDPRVTAWMTFALVTALSGAAVTAAGPISFLGLIAPFLARRIAGENLRRAGSSASPGARRSCCWPT